MKASSLYPIEKVRDTEWVKTMGHTPTLMDYSRFNYVAQPEDGIAPASLVPQIGPYDKWATMWGYKPIPRATTPDEEKATLDAWAREQDATPWLRFSTAGSMGSDPGELTEAVGDADAVQATTLGYKNLGRVAGFLLAAATVNGDPWDDLSELYSRLVGQWATEANHVAAIVGGLSSRQVHGGQQGVRFTLVPKPQQIDALKFLNDNVFIAPTFLLNPEVLRRIEPQGAIERITRAQGRVLASLTMASRLSRMVEEEAIDGVNAYKPADMLTDLRRGLWRELDAPAVRIDAYRRAIQRAQVQMFGERLNGRDAVSDEARALYRGNLVALERQVTAAQARAADTATRYHLADVRREIGRVLDPKFQAAAPTQPGSTGRPTWDEIAAEAERESTASCWPDASGVDKNR
jgi:hypothetical protein